MPIWDPQSVLDLYPAADTCSGTTKKGLRCRQSMISNADRLEAAAIMKHMSRSEPHTIKPEVYQELAYLTLCPRWHRKPGYSQVHRVATQFQRNVDEFCSQQRNSAARTMASSTRRQRPQELPSRRIQLIEEEPLPTSPSSQRRRHSSTLPARSSESLDSDTDASSTESESSSTESESSSTESESSFTESESSSTTSSASMSTVSNRSSQSQLPSSRPTTAPPSSSGSRRSPDANSASTPTTPARRDNRTETPPATPPTTPPTSSLSSTASESPASPPTTPRSSTNDRPLPPSPPPSQPHTPPQASATTHSHQTPRKSTDDPCPVCYESLTHDTSVYCRRQCGTNVHRECFRNWRMQQFLDWEIKHPLHGSATPEELGAREKRKEAAVRCMFCRSQWMWEWEDS